MERIASLLEPQDCVLLIVDFQAGLAFGVESSPRQALLNNAIALVQTAVTFGVPIVASTSASKVYSGPLIPALQAAMPGVVPIERRNMNCWEDDHVREAILATGRKRLLIAGLLTEACVSFPALAALENGYEVFVVADACGGLSQDGHHLALRRMESAGARVTSWAQVLLEMQRDWTRQATYLGASTIVKTFGGGYGMGLVYAKEMVHPA
jgi:nicotinamidase-related amidase